MKVPARAKHLGSEMERLLVEGNEILNEVGGEAGEGAWLRVTRLDVFWR